ncbi:MAG TPA: ribosome small subunit-dependent GTPase A [Lentimicrobium sp.]|nr:ribosome small subunit-dependent GTPase A [Lentimicrobium sp.]
MTLEDLGFNSALEKFRKDNSLEVFEAGRITAEHKERYIVKTSGGEYEAEITGNMRFSARSREDFPAVGDWVALSVFDHDTALIQRIYPRQSVIVRTAVGKTGERQVIAANIDLAFIMQAADRDYNINRLERYLTISYESGVTPVIVLTKTDLTGEGNVANIIEGIKQRISGVQVIPISNISGSGYDEIRELVTKGKTCCMLGSSGVGKSSLMNNLAGRSIMQTGSISESTNKGRHITSHRELVILENGGMLIDNPGIREVGIADSDSGLEITFNQIYDLAKGCKFDDCTHTNETGCRVIEAVEEGTLDNSSYQNYLKMEREKAHFEETAFEKRKKEKAFGKIMKDYKKLQPKEVGSRQGKRKK